MPSWEKNSTVGPSLQMDKSGQEFATALAASCRGIDILQFCILPRYFDLISARKWITLHLVFIFTRTRRNTTHPYGTAFKTFVVVKIFSFLYLSISRTRVVEAAYLDGQEYLLYKRPRRPKSQIWNEVFPNSDLKWGLQMRWLKVRGLVKLLWLVTGKQW
jgi:hypothetical protein